jgi:hypothetical protein
VGHNRRSEPAVRSGVPNVHRRFASECQKGEKCFSSSFRIDPHQVHSGPWMASAKRQANIEAAVCLWASPASCVKVPRHVRRTARSLLRRSTTPPPRPCARLSGKPTPRSWPRSGKPPSGAGSGYLLSLSLCLRRLFSRNIPGPLGISHASCFGENDSDTGAPCPWRLMRQSLAGYPADSVLRVPTYVKNLKLGRRGGTPP